MKKKGLSQVVSTAVLIMITVIAGVILATTIIDFSERELEKSQGCFELIDKIKINDEFTCYNPREKFMQVSIIREDVDVESILVAIMMDTNSFNFRLDNTIQNIPLVRNYPDNNSEVSMVGKQGARTYFVYGIPTFPLKVEIAPRTEKTQCKVMDSFETIPVC